MGMKKQKDGKDSRIKEGMIKKEIDNSVLIIGLYNQDSCILVANFFILNLPSRRTEDVRA